jgi:hypothetical protein
MKVQTNLKAGITTDEIVQGAQSALTSAGNAIGSAAQSISQQAQALVNNPSVRETVDKLKWWPFGPPQI